MAIYDHRRRVFLGKALTVGCVLVAPSLLLGCDAGDEERGATTENDASRTDFADSGSSSDTPSTPGDKVTGHMTKEKAKYQHYPNDEEMCGNCEHFVAESQTCELVMGKIQPRGWCRVWIQES